MSFFALAFLWRKSSWLFESWIFSSMLFRKVWLVDQSVHFHFQFLKGQSSFAPWRLHCQAKVKVKTKRGEKMNSSRWNTTQILEIVFFFNCNYIELEEQMTLRVSAVSASGAWPQITGIKSRLSTNYQHASSRLPTTAHCNQPTNCTTSLQLCIPFPISPPTQELRIINLWATRSVTAMKALSKQF